MALVLVWIVLMFAFTMACTVAKNHYDPRPYPVPVYKGGYHQQPGVAVGYKPYRYLGYNPEHYRSYGVDGFGYKRTEPKLKQFGHGQYYGRSPAVPYGPSFHKVPAYHPPSPYKAPYYAPPHYL